MVQERWVEARHAINKKNLAAAHNVGPAYVGFMSALPKLRQLLTDGDLGQLTALCERTTTMSRVFTEMKFNHHPETMRILRECATHVADPSPGDYRFAREFNRKGYNELVKVLFHSDRQTLHRGIDDMQEAEPT